MKLSLILTIISFSSMAQYNNINDKTCHIYIHQKSEKVPYLYQSLKFLLKERGFSFSKMAPGQKYKKGELYLAMKVIQQGKVYKDCYVEIKAQRVKKKQPDYNDEVVFKEHMYRKYPRHTFKGKERCEMSFKNISFRIPVCNKR